MGCMLSHLASKFAFFPPSPPTYQIKKREDGKLMVVSTSPAPVMPVPHCDENSLDVLLIDTKYGNKIVAFYLRNPYARLTLLYSHGNAADLGQLYDLFVQLKLNLRVNLMGYDYSGYGASTGKPSESNTYADIEAVYECLETKYGVSQEDIILYGQSVGSGPTLHLAAKLPRLRGVVLHSAILSGLRVLCHVKFTLCFDIYKNIDKIQKVKCPVLVIHGTEDDVVNWLHGNGLWEMAREPYEPLWIKGGGHCNLELYPDYIRHLCRFVQEMENITTKTRLKKLRPILRTYDSSSSAKKWWKIKLRRPKCPQCSMPKCSMPKCSMPSFSCLKCPKSCRIALPTCSFGCFGCKRCALSTCPFGCKKCALPTCPFGCFGCKKCALPTCLFGCFGCKKCSLPTCSFGCFGCKKCALPTCSFRCFECWVKPTWPSCLKCQKPTCCCNGCFGCAEA